MRYNNYEDHNSKFEREDDCQKRNKKKNNGFIENVFIIICEDY